LLEKRHNVETSSRIFGRGSTNSETGAIRSIASALPFHSSWFIWLSPRGLWLRFAWIVCTTAMECFQKLLGT